MAANIEIMNKWKYRKWHENEKCNEKAKNEICNKYESILSKTITKKNKNERKLNNEKQK